MHNGGGMLSRGSFLVLVAELAVAYPSSSVGYGFASVGLLSGKCDEQTLKSRFGYLPEASGKQNDFRGFVRTIIFITNINLV